MNIFISALIGNLTKKYKEVSIEQTYPGGTLGIFFELNINGKRKFVKTHQAGNTYRDNLLKEITIMSLVYKDIIDIERVDIEIGENTVTFLIMDYLFPAAHQVEAGQVRKCIDTYQSQLLKNPIEVKYTFNDIIEAGTKSLELLYEKQFLSDEMYYKCGVSMTRIWSRRDNYIPFICHGDLSNVNIMCNENGELVVIDWEDALSAFPEYDFLYWLTFFSQRKYYSIDVFKENNIEIVWGTDIMVLITIIKSALSYENGSYMKNSLSFEDRINEIYHIIE